MRHLLVASVSACCMALTLATGHDQCRLSDIPIQPQFDQARFRGVWYQVEWYPVTWPFEFAPWQDVSYVISEVKGETKRSQIRRYYKEPYAVECGPEALIVRDEVRPGYYIDTKWDNSQSIHIIAYTDYDRFAVEFSCGETDGDICRMREVSFWSRTKEVREEDTALGRRLVSRLCVQPDQHFTIVQNRGCPSQVENKPDDKGVKPLPDSRENGELLRAQKEMLKASRDKLLAETEVMRLRKEKIKLEIQHLRRRYNLR